MSDDAPDLGGSTPDEMDESRAPQWKPPASQEELDKIIKERVARVQKRYADYDTLREKAARADALDNELASDKEKAVKAAREEERKAILAEATPRLVKAEFRAAAKGVLTREQLDSLLEDVDLNRYVTDTGDVDEERINRKISALAPPKEDKPRFPDLGGGNRGGNASSTDMNQKIRQMAGRG